MQRKEFRNIGGFVACANDAINIPSYRTGYNGTGIHAYSNIANINILSPPASITLCSGQSIETDLYDLGKISSQNQPVQVSIPPFPLFEYIRDKTTVIERGWFGRTKEKVVEGELRKFPKRSSKVLREYDNEPLYQAEWFIPHFQGFGNERRFTQFNLVALLGEKEARRITQESKSNPAVVRELGEQMFPDIFEALRQAVPYEEVSHLLADITDPSYRVPFDVIRLAKRVG
jgi:hypothetical protein